MSAVIKAQDMERMLAEKAVPPIKSLDDLLVQLDRVFSCEGDINVDYIKALLAAYKSNREDWKQYAMFDTHRYTRNLIADGRGGAKGKYNLMALCWGEQHGSSIHAHENAHCFVKVLNGNVRETMFAWPAESEEESEMTVIADNTYPTEGVTYINDSMGLHRVENPSHTEGAITMHLYSPPYNTCKIFDEKTGHENTVRTVFYSEFGNRTKFTATDNQCSEVCDAENN